jgi:threonine synthase
LYAYGPAGLGWVAEAASVAEGIRVRSPVRGDAVLEAIYRSQGMMLAVEDEQILEGRNQLALRGFYVEPTSAVVWPALAQLVKRTPEPLVAILTGSGLKYVQG